VADLVILKSAGSAFSGFLHDEYTTLSDTRDRLLATALTASWRYRATEVHYDASWYAVRRTLLEIFATHTSESVQHTLYAMGRAVLESAEEVDSIHLVMPNKREPERDLRRHRRATRNNRGHRFSVIFRAFQCFSVHRSAWIAIIAAEK
jgi:urate oxidase